MVNTATGRAQRCRALGYVGSGGAGPGAGGVEGGGRADTARSVVWCQWQRDARRCRCGERACVWLRSCPAACVRGGVLAREFVHGQTERDIVCLSPFFFFFP